MLIKYNIVRWETKSDWWKSVCFSLPKNFLRSACYVLLITVKERKRLSERMKENEKHIYYPEIFYVHRRDYVHLPFLPSHSVMSLLSNCFIPQASLQSKYITYIFFAANFPIHKRFHGTHSCFSGEYLNICMYFQISMAIYI